MLWGNSVHVSSCLGMVMAAGWISVASALGTPVGTVISNTVTLQYSIAGAPADPITSPSVSLTVDEIINLTLTWQDASPVSVNSPDTDDALTFLVTNTGNGLESFQLSRNNALAGDNYDPVNGSGGSIFLENGLAVGFQLSGPNADSVYSPGINNPLLNPNDPSQTSRLIYVLSDTPTALPTGNMGLLALTAESTTPGAASALPGASLTGLGQGGVDAVVGGSRATTTQNGTYLIVGSLTLTIQKTVASVLDARGGTNVEPGSTLTYRLTVDLTGTGTATNLVITDPLPGEMSYVPDSILVNSTARTDASDADNAQFSGSTVTVSFGDTPAPIVHVIEFRSTVN